MCVRERRCSSRIRASRITALSRSRLSLTVLDHGDDQPAFALAACLLAVYWLAQGYGYEITSADVWAAYSTTIKLAERMGKADGARSDISRIAASVQGGANLVARILGRELGLR